MYAVNTYVRGKPNIITIDDYVPSSSGYPIFAGIGLDGALWGPVLEKVWARTSGNYERINEGLPAETMRFLANCPTEYYDLTTYDADTIWQVITNAEAQNYIMVTGTTGGTDSTTNSFGLANSHAYTMMGAYIIQAKNGTTY